MLRQHRIAGGHQLFRLRVPLRRSHKINHDCRSPDLARDGAVWIVHRPDLLVDHRDRIVHLYALELSVRAKLQNAGVRIAVDGMRAFIRGKKQAAIERCPLRVAMRVHHHFHG